MHTIIESKAFQIKVKDKFSDDIIETILEKISNNPKIGKKFESVNNLFKIKMGLTLNKKYEYELVYFYQSKSEPIFIVNLYKKKEKDILSKVVSTLVNEHF